MKKIYTLVMALWTASSISAQTPVIFKDINAGAGNANFLYPKMIEEKLYFAADNGTDGLEPWVTDGTADGTYRIANIAPAGAHSTPRDFTLHNGKIYFTADDGTHGRELWVTDGTESGTHLIMDINPSGTDTGPVELVSALGYLFFQANDGVNGAELWKTDGTTAGTSMVVDFRPGISNSYPANIMEYNGRIYFEAVTEFLGAEPCFSDGTAQGTAMLKDIAPGSTQHGGMLSPIVHGGLLFFVGFTQNIGYELWTTDGTEENTERVVDLMPGPVAGASGIAGMYIYNNELYLSARIEDNFNWQLWKTDGTESGTVPVSADPVFYGVDARNLNQAFEFNNKLYYYQSIASNGGRVMWATDGTQAGTQLAAPVPTGTYNWALSAAPLADTLYYIDRNPANNQLHVWKSLGDAASAVMLPHPAGGSPTPIDYVTGWLGQVGGKILYYARHNMGLGYELYTLQPDEPSNVTEAKAQQNITVYPNPATDKLFIQGFEGTAKVYDIAGRQVLSQKVMSGNAIDIAQLPSGTYQVQMMEGENKNIIKFIKQ